MLALLRGNGKPLFLPIHDPKQNTKGRRTAMDTPLISIIVPIYKVEPYLRKCLDSIVHQTHRNLEIILVDDGSPDNCGTICDEYAAQDCRIKVIHKPNGGVSSARNAGLAEVTGEYIGWVDPDDWVELDMFEYLITNLLSAGADIAVCGYYDQFREKCAERSPGEKQILEKESALAALLEDRIIHTGLWNKLWSASLYDGLLFPNSRTYEDLAVIHRLFLRASKTICLPQSKYYYFHRPKSILDDTSLSSRINSYLAAKDRLNELAPAFPQFLPALESACVASATTVWGCYLANPKDERQRYAAEIKEISEFCKLHWKNSSKNVSIGLAGRAVIPLTPYPRLFAFAMARAISVLFGIRHGRSM